MHVIACADEFEDLWEVQSIDQVLDPGPACVPSEFY
jgi:hypothetical protein